MIDYQRLFHVGVRVRDLDAAMEELGAAFGVTWATPMDVAEQPLWTPGDGARTVPLRFVYSCEGPQHLELLQGAAGTVWDGSDHPGLHHVGVWADDVAAEVDRCVASGWELVAAHLPPEQGYGVFCYVRPPSGALVELVWSAVARRLERWWAGGTM